MAADNDPTKHRTVIMTENTLIKDEHYYRKAETEMAATSGFFML